MEPDEFIVNCGNQTIIAKHFPVSCISLNGRDLISIDKLGDELKVSAHVYSEDHRIIAKIEQNNFTLNPNNTFDLVNEPRNILAIQDDHENWILKVNYHNRRSTTITGIFGEGIEKYVILNPDKTIVMPQRDVISGADCTRYPGYNLTAIQVP